MNRNPDHMMISNVSSATVLLGFSMVTFLGASVLAQTGNGYDLTWNSIDSGGVMFSTGGSYKVGGTIGQADAGLLTGGSYRIYGGFWVPAACPASSPPQVELIPDAIGNLVVSTKNRYLSFTAGDPGQQQAIRIKITSAPAGFGSWVGSVFWVGVPSAVSELSGKDDATPPTFQRSQVECLLTNALFLTNWASRGTIHVTGRQILPGATYEITVVDKVCNPAAEASFPPASTVVLDTARWGDVAGQFDGGIGIWTAPDSTVSVTFDVVSILDKFKNAPTAPSKARADIQPHPVDAKITIVDVTRALDAFAGAQFPFSPANPAAPCP